MNSIPYRERTTYARNLLREINTKLATGWTPFVETKESITLKDALEHYVKTKTKELRERTLKNYLDNIRVLNSFLDKKGIVKLSDLTKDNVAKLLNYVYIKNKWGEYRFNRFLTFCISLWNYFKEFQFTDENIFLGFRKKKEKEKIRKMLTDEQLSLLFEYLKEHQEWYLFYVYLTFYVFVRPKEISLLKVRDFNLRQKILIIPPEVSKNGKRQVVTLPKKVINLMNDLNFTDLNIHWNICSGILKPGADYRTPKYISKKWAKLRPILEFPKELQFYSLKDTGIVKMIQAGVPPNIVRDQARHYSLEVTNRYVQLANEGASSEILDKVNY